MPNWPFRFVHAADFHLEMPPFGVAEVPPHLRETFLESAYMAAERVFDITIGEEADFLVLSGDILNCRDTGPRGPLFIIQQCERLAARGIAVYWAGGRVDSLDDWPPSLRLPQNVRRFPSGKADEFIHRRDGSPLARLIGAERTRRGRINAADFNPAAPGLFTLAVAHGSADADDFHAARVDYWALGGRHEQLTVSPSNPLVHYPGSPQGRQPEECGPHGCTLVQVDESSLVQVSQMHTDVLRWHELEIEINEKTTPEQFEGMLDERIRSLAASAAVDQLICWKVTGSGPLIMRLRNGPQAELVLDRLRKQYGHKSPAAWSVSMSVKSTAGPPQDWYEPSTIRGDFLLSLKNLKKNARQSLGLERFLPEGADKEIAKIVQPGGGGRRNAIRGAALLGADLLSGEEAER